MHLSRRLGVAALLGILVLSGCGQGTETGSTAPPPSGYEPLLTYEQSGVGSATTSTFQADGAWQVKWGTSCSAGGPSDFTIQPVAQNGEIMKPIDGDPSSTSTSPTGQVTYHSGTDVALAVSTSCPWHLSVYTYPSGGQSQ